MQAYDEYQEDVNHIIREIGSLRKANKNKEADLKKLELIYKKIEYNQSHIDLANSQNRSPHASYVKNLNSALSEIADYRDYLYEKYQYEE